MTARRLALLTVLVFMLALGVAGLAAQRARQSWLQSQHIEQIHWQGLDVGLHGLTLGHLDVRQQQRGAQRSVALEDVRLRWDWRWPLPQLMTVRVAQARLSIGKGESEAAAEGALPEWPVEPPSWLPRHLLIEAFHAEVPCATGRCQLAGSLSLSRQDQLLPLVLELVVNRAGHRLGLTARVSGNAPEVFDLEASLALDDQPALGLSSVYRSSPSQGVTWSGKLDMPTLPTADWLMHWLAQWQPLPDLTLPPADTGGSLTGHWRLQAQDTASLWRPSEGKVDLSFRLPQAWPVPGVAAVQGELTTEWTARNGQWTPRSLMADLTLSQPADWVGALPEPLRPRQIRVLASPGSASGDAVGTLPLQLTISTRGPTEMTLETGVSLTTEPPWRADLTNARLQARHRRLALGDVTLEQLAADLRVSGSLTASHLQWQFSRNTRLRFGSLETPGEGGFTTGQGALDLAGQTLAAEYDALDGELSAVSLTGPVALSLDSARHPSLKAQAWQGRGRLALDLKRLATTLRVSAATGLASDLSLSYPFGGTLVMDARSSVSASAASQQLAGVLAAWPDTLTLEAGGIVAEANVQQGPDRPGVISGHLQLDALAGTWDRTAFHGLNGDLNGHLEAGGFSIGTDDLRLAELNPGVPVGPLDLAGVYQGDTDRPMAGRLELEQAVADFLGGQVRIPPGRWSFDNQPVRVPLQLERLELSQLMALYPAEGLAGTGILSGQVPLLISDEGIRVEQGRVVALDPGGVLKLPAEKIAAIGQGNQAMDLIAEALKNFHYSVLNSTVDYDQDGLLNLSLRLEGRNPEVRDGYPIVLNIDLEENLPALLTSLQLSGRVNEAVTERVRELVRQRDGASEN